MFSRCKDWSLGAAALVALAGCGARLHREDFSAVDFGRPEWKEDALDDGPFGDRGAFFRRRGVTAPAAYRISQPFGDDGWLTAECYSRSRTTAFGDLLRAVPDPAGGDDRVLRLRVPAHTDAVVIRPTRPLPPSYRVSLRVGFADFGDGEPGGRNGYDGGETAGPWWKKGGDIGGMGNGFYWLAILDAVPRPHNNVWIHHRRKVVIDSDNHFPPWMEIHDGRRFVASGKRPVMMFALDGRSTPSPWIGHAFLSWSGGAWQPSGSIRAVDAYRAATWYRVAIERRGDRFTLEVEGNFQFGGVRRHRATIDAARRCVWHYNREPAAADPRCLDRRTFPELGPAGGPHWPASGGWPDYFMFGDPHSNFYEGTVYYDDVTLETL